MTGLKQFPPPGARGKFTPDLYTKPGWMAEEKLDGDRRIAQFCYEPATDRVRVRFTGRRVSDVDGLLVEKTDNVPHLNGSASGTVLSPVPLSLQGTVLDGEMTCPWPGARSKDVTSIMGSKPDKAVAKQMERGWLQYVVFDCLFYKGEDIRHLSLHERKSYVSLVVQEWNNPHVVRVASTYVDREDFCLGIWKNGGEGIILKDLSSKYGDEKAWVKVKKEDTHDVVIIGYDAPEAVTEKVETYKDADGVRRKRVLEVSESRLAKNGWIGAIRFGQYKRVTEGDNLVDAYEQAKKNGDMFAVYEQDGDENAHYVLTYCGSMSGMDDALRKEISENKERFLGRVVEVLANEREETGKFRHPRFVQLRDDKPAKQCIWGNK